MPAMGRAIDQVLAFSGGYFTGSILVMKFQYQTLLLKSVGESVPFSCRIEAETAMKVMRALYLRLQKNHFG
jgi:hypothetical protein